MAGKEIRGQLQTLGVLRSSGHEHLNGCLVVPVIGIEDAAIAEFVYATRFNGAIAR